MLADAIRRTVARGGSVLVPAFAIDRTELVLLRIGALMTQGLVPTVPVHVDSPMALRGARRLPPRPGRRRPRAAAAPAGTRAPSGCPTCAITRTATESQALNEPRHPCVIISASGMATGGRVVHHLAHQLGDPRNCVVLTGYQAVGTRGRDLLSGARQVKIHGRYVPVRAEVVDDPEFSVHADADEVLDWLGRCDPAPRDGVRRARRAGGRRRPWPPGSATSSAGARWCRATASGSAWTERSPTATYCEIPTGEAPERGSCGGKFAMSRGQPVRVLVSMTAR